MSETAARSAREELLTVLAPYLDGRMGMGDTKRMLSAIDRLAAATDHCPAAKHHRVRTYRKGGIVGTTEDGDDFTYAPDTLEADRCTACNFDFLAESSTITGVTR